MLGKLFRHEMKQSSRLLLLLHTIALLISLMVFGLLKAPGVRANFLFGALLPFGCALILIGIAFFTYFSFGMRLYQTVFSDQGYLTNTLPVTPGQLLLSRFFTAVIWSMLNTLVLYVGFCFLTGENIGAILLHELGKDTGYTGFMLWMILLSIVGFLCNILSIFCCVAIGNLFGGHKILGSVIALFGINLVLQILSFLPFLLKIGVFLEMPTGNYSLTEFQERFPAAFDALYFVIGGEAIISAIACVVLYWLTWHLMNKHLNLE